MRKNEFEKIIFQPPIASHIKHGVVIQEQELGKSNYVRRPREIEWESTILTVNNNMRMMKKKSKTQNQ